MDGLFHGSKPYEQIDKIFTHPYFWFNIHIMESCLFCIPMPHGIPMSLSHWNSWLWCHDVYKCVYN